ncbi:MAG: zinc-ribbon domain-containing protein [Chloroflexota bacterium]
MTQQKAKKQPCCPYCDEEMLQADLPYCKPCSMTILYCPECHKPVARNSKKCSHCGATIQR